jgi:hypothetical protein
LWLRVVLETGATVANVLFRAVWESAERALSAMGLQRIIFLSRSARPNRYLSKLERR